MRGMIKEERPYQPWPHTRLHTTVLSTDGDCRNAEGQDVSGREEKIGVICLQMYEY